MSSIALQTTPSKKERFSTRISFFVAGFGLAAWAPLVPFVKVTSELSDGALGLLLLCLGIGSIVAMPLAGIWSRSYGCRAVLLAAAALVAAALPILALSTSSAILAFALFVFGAGIGAMDCVMNVQAVIVERASGKTMMSGFHSLFSVGGLVGASAMTLLLSSGASPWLSALAIAGIIVGAMLTAAPSLLPYGATGEGPMFIVPHGAVLLIGALCFILFLAEGAVLDWSAVFLTQSRNVDPGVAGFAYTSFALAMMIGRLTGDALVDRFGSKLVFTVGPLCASAGLLFATISPWSFSPIIGFGLVGIGCANVVPILFSAVGRQKDMPAHVAIPAITTIGYAGVLAGPAGIGLVAQWWGLSVAFILVAGLLVAVAAGGHRALRV